MCKANCFECQHSEFIRGCAETRWEPGEPDAAECQNEKVDQKLFDKDYDYEQLAEECGQFTPILIDKCGHCGKPINQPRYTWTLHEYEFFSGEPVPMCSEECKTEFKEKQDEWEHHFEQAEMEQRLSGEDY